MLYTFAPWSNTPHSSFIYMNFRLPVGIWVCSGKYINQWRYLEVEHRGREDWFGKGGGCADCWGRWDHYVGSKLSTFKVKEANRLSWHHTAIMNRTETRPQHSQLSLMLVFPGHHAVFVELKVNTLQRIGDPIDKMIASFTPVLWKIEQVCINAYLCTLLLNSFSFFAKMANDFLRG